MRQDFESRRPTPSRPTCRLGLEPLEDRSTPAVVAIGSPAGTPPVAKLVDQSSGQVLFEVSAYDAAFTGGVQEATADLDGDRVPDLVTAPGPGGGPRVRAFSGATGAVLHDFFAYEPEFRGGVIVSAGDLPGDRRGIATGAGPGGSPRVRVFDGPSGQVVRDLFDGDPAGRDGATAGAVRRQVGGPFAGPSGSGGAALMSTPPTGQGTVLYEETTEMGADLENDNLVLVTTTVTELDADTYLWHYKVTNVNFAEVDDDGGGPLSNFAVWFGEGAAVPVWDVENTRDWDYSLGEEGTNWTFVVGWGTQDHTKWIQPGESAEFWFKSPPTGIRTAAAELSGRGFAHGTGEVKGPGTVAFDLDVNANGTLDDAVDTAARYLPGYEGTTPKVSNGNQFNGHQYTGQKMKLIVPGVGTEDTPDVTKVEFRLINPTDKAGYASNKTAAAVTGTTATGEGKAKDYSFKLPSDADNVTVNKGGNPDEADATNVSGGKMETKKTWAYFFAKDYGGATTVEVRVYKDKDTPDAIGFLQVPKDTDKDGLADKWEVAMAGRWAVQYGTPLLTEKLAIAQYAPTQDWELADPDGQEPQVAQAEGGDAHTVFEEYRGYILDGGGFDWDGANGHAGGHVRLDPARKELLVEADRAKTINNIPAAGLPAMLDGTSKVFSNDAHGAGIFLYYLFDEVELDLPKEKLDTNAKRLAELKACRDTKEDRDAGKANLKTDFLHALFVDESGAGSTGAVTFDTNADRDQRGSLLSISDMKTIQVSLDLDPAKFDERIMTTTAHELTHLLFEKTTGDFNAGEHTKDPNGDQMEDEEDKACLMYKSTDRKNREMATVKFFDVVKKELQTKSNQSINS